MLLTVEEVANTLKVDPETIRRWLQTGKLRGSKISPVAWRVDSEDIDKFLASKINQEG
jgi:excisionase family DNA binding protein